MDIGATRSEIDYVASNPGIDPRGFRSLPVHPKERTSWPCEGMSQKCQDGHYRGDAFASGLRATKMVEMHSSTVSRF
jgi:hypothetical protein